VTVNDAPVLTGFDILAAAGRHGRAARTFPVTVKNGRLVVRFTGNSAMPALVNGIEVTSRKRRYGAVDDVVQAPKSRANLFFGKARLAGGPFPLDVASNFARVKRNSQSRKAYSREAQERSPKLRDFMRILRKLRPR
jgi:hypothetical protein